MITGFNHTSFTVADLDRTVRFWTETMGFHAASVGERSGKWQERLTGVPGARLKIAHLYGYDHHMEFIQYLEGNAPGSWIEPNMPGAAHICLEVSDIAGTVRRMIAAGATAQGEIIEVMSGPVRGGKASYIRDPNGILIELYEPAGTARR
ncbi:MAG TPA: VOC family protein [Alphaproteobacteria bacterium]|nr:VOC family protein [Alphaproteobacteria bacterium]